MASTPAVTSSHRSSGEPTPPGKRQAMPTIATGSCRRPSSSARRRRVSDSSTVARLR